MADGDYFARNLAPKWGKVRNTLLGEQDVGVVAGLAREAYAETMRLGNGVPGLNELCSAFVVAARQGDRLAWMATNEEIRRDAKHHANTEIAAMAGQALLENDDGRFRGMSNDELAETLAKATAERIAKLHFNKCRQGRLPDTYTSIGELQVREREAMARMDTAGLAREMLRHEDGRGFKAPARQTSAAGTKGLIGLTIVGPS